MSEDPMTTESQPMSDVVRDRLRDARGFVFDMDGTMVLGDRGNDGLKPLPGAIEITQWLTQRSVPFLLFTNGTKWTPEHYAHTLHGLGFTLSDGAIMTPATAAADVFVRRGYRRVMVLGTEGLVRPLEEAGISVVPPLGRPRVDAVMAGWYREFTMDSLEAACHAVWGGARLYSSSQSVFFATAEGRTVGTSRAITAMIRSLTGCRIGVVGKPSLNALRSAGRRLGVGLRDLAVVGDDPDLEVPMAHRGHALAIAVRTGLGGAEAFAHLPRARWPHLVVDDVDELLTLYQRLRGEPGRNTEADGGGIGDR
jgi:4-nitrophenyl phosphatase